MAYDPVNRQWPEVLPVPTGQEAISAVRRLYRFAMKKPFRGKFKLTSGNRYTWVKNHVYYVNPQGHHFGGWKDLVHDVSHRCHSILRPKDRAHDPRHEYLERDMVAYVLAQGWLDGKLRREPKPAPDPKVVKLASIEERIKRWRTKQKRAATALKKLERQRRRLAA
jgi:hypothetical protein